MIKFMKMAASSEARNDQIGPMSTNLPDTDITKMNLITKRLFSIRRMRNFNAYPIIVLSETNLNLLLIRNFDAASTNVNKLNRKQTKGITPPAPVFTLMINARCA